MTSTDDIQGTPLAPRAMVEILIEPAAVSEMLSHANEGHPLEIGGYLLGYKLEDTVNGRVFTYIDRAMRVESESTHTHVRFLTTNVVKIHNTCEQERIQIVGYYHSHPGFGVFQSGEDVQNFRNYYTEDHQVAVVIDPTKAGGGKRIQSHWLGFFVWDEHKNPGLLNDAHVRMLDARSGDVVKPDSQETAILPDTSQTRSLGSTRRRWGRSEG